MKIIDEFKAFMLRGNVIDLAVAVVIGGAFGKIVNSFVADIIMPPIGVLLGGVDFGNLSYIIKEAVGENPAVTLNYGAFIMTILDFLIIGTAIFAMVKIISSAKRKKEEAPAPAPTISKEEEILAEIRDILKNK